LADGYVGRVDEVCQVGDMLRVKVISIDDQDRVKLSRKVLLREENPNAGGGDMPPAPPRPPRPEGEQREGGGERRGGGGSGRGRGGPSRRSGGERRHD
jgi:polyribonucleotide nucleotidyltransferase